MYTIDTQKRMIEEKNKFQMLAQKISMLFITLRKAKQNKNMMYHNLLLKKLLCRYTLKNQCSQVLQLSPLSLCGCTLENQRNFPDFSQISYFPLISWIGSTLYLVKQIFNVLLCNGYYTKLTHRATV